MAAQGLYKQATTRTLNLIVLFFRKSSQLETVELECENSQNCTNITKQLFNNKEVNETRTSLEMRKKQERSRSGNRISFKCRLRSPSVDSKDLKYKHPLQTLTCDFFSLSHSFFQPNKYLKVIFLEGFCLNKKEFEYLAIQQN